MSSKENVSPLQIELTSTICSVIAIVVTLHRLWIRRKTHWIDDYCALFSCLCLITQTVVILVFRGHINTFTHTYLVLVASYATAWSARIAILFTIIRVRSGRHHILIFATVVAGFTLIWGVMTAQLFWVCEPQRRSSTKPDICMLREQVGTLHIIASLIADLTLLLSGLRLFRVIQDSALRHRLKAIFSTCMATSIAAVVYGAFIFRGTVQWALVTSLIEASISLSVCSLPMVFNNVFHIIPATVHSPKQSFVRSGLLSPLSPISPASSSTLRFAPSPHPNPSLLCPSEWDKYGYDTDQTPVPSIRWPTKASDLERYDIDERPIRNPDVDVAPPALAGEELTRPLPVLQRPMGPHDRTISSKK